MEIPIFIDTDQFDDSACGSACPFFERYNDGAECKLFHTQLSETMLPQNQVWTSEANKTYNRTGNCCLFVEEDSK